MFVKDMPRFFCCLFPEQMTGLLERAKELRDGAAVTHKAKDDAPSYHRVGNASLQRCGTCRHFGDSGRCDLYEFDADAMYTCDGWRPDIERLKRARVETASGVTLKHLPGQHNQDAHGHGGSGESSGVMGKDEYIKRWLAGEKPRLPKELNREQRREYERDAMRAVTAQDRAKRQTTVPEKIRREPPKSGDPALSNLRTQNDEIKRLENSISLHTADHYISKVGPKYQAQGHRKLFSTRQEARNHVQDMPNIRRRHLLSEYQAVIRNGRTLSGADLDIYNQLTAALGYSAKEVSATPTAVYAHGPGGLFSPAGLGDTAAAGRKRKKRKPARDGELMNAMITTKPGDKYRSIKNPEVYEALIAKGMPKSQAAAISNAMAKRGKRKKKEITLKHLGGQHNQDAHGRRGAGSDVVDVSASGRISSRGKIGNTPYVAEVNQRDRYAAVHLEAPGTKRGVVTKRRQYEKGDDPKEVLNSLLSDTAAGQPIKPEGRQAVIPKTKPKTLTELDKTLEDSPGFRKLKRNVDANVRIANMRRGTRVDSPPKRPHEYLKYHFDSVTARNRRIAQMGESIRDTLIKNLGLDFVKNVAGAYNVNFKETAATPLEYAISLKHVSHDQKAHGARHGVQGLREFAKKRGYTVTDRGENHKGKYRYEIRGGRGGRDNMRANGLTSAKKLISSSNRHGRQADRQHAAEVKRVNQAKKYGPNHNNIAAGKRMFKKVRHGGELKLRSWNGRTDVDAKVRFANGVYSLALKRPGQKRYPTGRIMSQTQIAGYLASFQQRPAQKEYSPLAYAIALKHASHNQASHGFRFGKTPSLEQARRYRKGGVLGEYMKRASGDKPTDRQDAYGRLNAISKRHDEISGRQREIGNALKRATGDKKARLERERDRLSKEVGRGAIESRRLQKFVERDKKRLESERGDAPFEKREHVDVSGKPFKADLGKYNGVVARRTAWGEAQKKNPRNRPSQSYFGFYGSDGRQYYSNFSGQIFTPEHLERLSNRGQGWFLNGVDLMMPANKEQKTQPATFTVFKDKTGRYRWVAISSTAYRDRDGEIVSTKALADDVAHADATGEYGTLRWWHLPGYDLGDCDFNMLYGRSLIESGTFKNDRIAERVKEKAHLLKLSLGFRHPADEPDKSGVFHTIRRFERSLIPPEGNASNLFTRLVVT